MKLSCGQCGQGYDIPVSVVMEHDVKFPCRRCNAIVDGTHLRAQLDAQAAASEWYAITADGLVGPQTEDVVVGMARAGKIRPEDLVWHRGLKAWGLAGSTPPLAPAGRGRSQWWLRAPNLGDVADAMVEMLEGHPNHGPTENALNRLLQMGRCDESLLRYLERKRRASGDWEGLIELLERRLYRTSDIIRRQGLGLELAEVCRGQLGDTQRALDYMVDAFGATLIDESVRPVLVEAAQATRRTLEIVGIITALIEDGQLQANEASARTSAALHAAGGRYGEAYQALRAHAKTPGDYERLFDWLGRQERWGDAVDLLERMAETQVGDAHLASLGEIARLSLVKLAQPDRALRAYRAILRFDPYHEVGRAGLRTLIEDASVGNEAQRTLLKILGQTGDWVACVRVWELWNERLADPADRQHGLFEIARLLFHRIGQPDPAYEYAERALYAAPDAADAMAKYLELGLAAHQRSRCIDVLADLAERSDSIAERAVRIALKHRFTDERLLPAIIDYLTQTPQDFPDRLDLVSTTYEQAQANGPLLSLLEQAVQRCTNDDMTLGLLERLGSIASASADGHGIALGAWKRMADLPAGHRAGWCSIFEASGDVPAALYDEAAFNLSKMEDLAPEQMIRALRHTARRLVADGRLDDAAEAWVKLHRIEADDEEALFGLEHIYREAEDWRSLAEILQAKLQRSGPGERGPILVEMGLLWSERLGEPHLGRTFLEQAIQGGVDPMEVNERLLQLCEHLGDWLGLREHLRESLKHLEVAEQVTIYVRLVDLEAGPLDALQDALASVAAGYRVSGDVDTFATKALALWTPDCDWSGISARWTERDRSRGEGGRHAISTALFQIMAGECASALDTLEVYAQDWADPQLQIQAARLMEWASARLERWDQASVCAVEQASLADEQPLRGAALVRAAWYAHSSMQDPDRAHIQLVEALAFDGFHARQAFIEALTLGAQLERWQWVLETFTSPAFDRLMGAPNPGILDSVRVALTCVTLGEDARLAVYEAMARHGEFTHADWLGYGLALEALGQYDAALSAFSHAVSPDAQVSPLLGGLEGLARLARIRDDASGELEALTALHRLNALTDDVRLRLASLQVASGLGAACIETLLGVVMSEADVDTDDFESVLEAIFEAKVPMALDDQRRLLEYLHGRAPDSRVALSTLATLEAESGHESEAFGYLEALHRLGDISVETRAALAEYATRLDPTGEQTRLYWAELAATRTNWPAVSGWMQACEAVGLTDDAFVILDDYIDRRPDDVPDLVYRRWLEGLPAQRRFDGLVTAMRATGHDGLFGDLADEYTDDEDRLEVLLEVWTRVRRGVQAVEPRRSIQR
ncbi:MAG: hypothetical protein VX589_11255, partial [Myxococcota bacterium]|nr:hypothetical protein [Myxococcota bacterium]